MQCTWRLSLPYVLVPSTALSKLGLVTFENGKKPCVTLNGTPTPFSVGILRHDSQGFGDRWNTDKHVMAYQDFILFPKPIPGHTMAYTPLFVRPSEGKMLTSFPQPDYSANTAPAARRSRSPTRDRENNNSYRDQRSPAANNYDRSDRRPSRSEQPNMEDRQNSQQDRRVYVGNLSYDVKWHHLKDHMREGMANSPAHSTASLRDTDYVYSRTGSLRRRPRAPERNEQG
jgi:hypothetical protein